MQLKLIFVPAAILFLLGCGGVEKVPTAPAPAPITPPVPIAQVAGPCRNFDAMRAAEEAYRQCVGKLPLNFQASVQAEAVGQLKKQYGSMVEGSSRADPPAEEFKRLNGLTDFLLAIDPRDGHGLYYKGEAQRLQYRKNPDGNGFLGSHAHFQRYLDTLKKISQETLPRPIGCANDAIGYCPERTAWIANHLAQDFYRAALAKPRDERGKDLCQAARYAEFALSLRPAGEFRDPLQGIPTEDMIEDARGQIARFRLGPCR